MKRLLILLLLLPSLAWGSDLGQDYARMSPYILGGGASAAAGCTLGSGDSSLVDYVESGSTTSFVLIVCTKWEPATNVTITKYVHRLSAVTAGNVRACLLPHDAGNNQPDGTTCIAGTDKSLNHDEISDTLADTNFELATAKDIDAGTYWICNIKENSAQRGQVYHAATGRVAYYDSSWHPSDGNVYDMEVYGCTR